jgi:hypothetical protein
MESAARKSLRKAASRSYGETSKPSRPAKTPKQTPTTALARFGSAPAPDGADDKFNRDLDVLWSAVTAMTRAEEDSERAKIPRIAAKRPKKIFLRMSRL